MINSDFISCAANTSSHSLVWLNDGHHDSYEGEEHATSDYIAYTSANLLLIAICDVETLKHSVICSLKGHKGRINSFTKLCTSHNWKIITTGEDGRIIVWQNNTKISSISDWKILCQIDLDTPMMHVAAVQCSSGILIAAADAYGKIYIYSLNLQNINQLDLVHIINFNAIQTPNELHFCQLNEEVLSLFIGAVDGHIYLYAGQITQIIENHQPLILVGSLTGHEDWISCINSYFVKETGVMLVASGSQDSKIRLWHISSEPIKAASSSSSDMHHAEFTLTNTTQSLASNVVENSNDVGEVEEEELDEIEEGEGRNQGVIPETDDNQAESRLTFSVGTSRYFVYLDALLIGHEDWITSINWLHGSTQQGTDTTPIFSTSMDRNMIIWSPDQYSGIWIPNIRIGDVGGTLGGSVGGNLLGFVGGAVSTHENAVIGVGYGGSFHLWKEDTVSGRWTIRPFISGHFGTVNDIQWAPNGEFLVTASSDQTCRVFSKVTSAEGWFEISRPQIHGFDLNCIALSPADGLTLYSGGDEKLIRIFEAPTTVLDGLKTLCDVDIISHGVSRIVRAYIPELGLSNKPANLMSSAEQSEMAARGVEGLTWRHPPLEGQLADHTIWPETRKLYGHTNDVQCMAITFDGGLLASACKARDSEHAVILLWDTKTFLNIGTLSGHESTVACLRFSKNDRYLASSGKDRSLCLFLITKGNNTYIAQPYLTIKKAHKRIVWDCSWSSSSRELATVSRDGTCKVWRIGSDDTPSCNCVYEFIPFGGVSVTAVDICLTVDDSILLALGDENGDISVWRVNSDTNTGHVFGSVAPNESHGLTVKRIKWRPLLSSRSDVGDMLQFGSCGDDYSVRVFSVRL